MYFMLIYSVEDDKNIAKIITLTLKQQGYEVIVFDNYKDFINAMNTKSPALILLDMMLPDIHGLDIIKEIRENKKWDNIDIIVISADHLLLTKLDSFDLGADDYIEKPFDILELTSRINARFRKKNKNLFFAEFTLDNSKRAITKGDTVISLTEKEFEIITLLVINKSNVVSREMILEKIWGSNEIIETRVIDMHIKTIRKKLDTDKIETVYGLGYKVLD